MAGCKAEVISLLELQTHSRAGVRLLDSEVFDAVPLEALLVPSPSPKRANPWQKKNVGGQGQMSPRLQTENENETGNKENDEGELVKLRPMSVKVDSRTRLQAAEAYSESGDGEATAESKENKEIKKELDRDRVTIEPKTRTKTKNTKGNQINPNPKRSASARTRPPASRGNYQTHALKVLEDSTNIVNDFYMKEIINNNNGSPSLKPSLEQAAGGAADMRKEVEVQPPSRVEAPAARRPATAPRQRQGQERHVVTQEAAPSPSPHLNKVGLDFDFANAEFQLGLTEKKVHKKDFTKGKKGGKEGAGSPVKVVVPQSWPNPDKDKPEMHNLEFAFDSEQDFLKAQEASKHARIRASDRKKSFVAGSKNRAKPLGDILNKDAQDRDRENTENRISGEHKGTRQAWADGEPFDIAGEAKKIVRI